MTDWILPSNPETFDTESALRDRGVMDWSEASNAHIRSGDRVFIYEVAPTSAIVHCCKVSRTGMSSDEATDDSVYWRNPTALEERRDRTRMRLELLHTFSAVERADLGLNSLKSRGLRVGLTPDPGH
jgi:predicted RNA-binding protein with PUA-like domain